jgi:NAD(P) transhydrogenase subunit alpha
MIIGVIKERTPEHRVALTPETAKALLALHTELVLETSAGTNAFMSDSEFSDKGVKIVTRQEVLQADCIISVNGLLSDDFEHLAERKVLIGHLPFHGNQTLLDHLIRHKITAFSLDLLPRTSLAQSMDILSSMATVSGYRAVLDAAVLFPRFFPMFMTASGTIKPAKVLVLGAGVAGLQAVATARRLGAVVEVFDVRSAVKEEVHSLGGKFIEVEGSKEDRGAGGYAVEQNEDYKIRQGELIHNHAIKSDVIICTAQIPGKKAPLLIHTHTVEHMAPGSVIIDLAASTGGNCELTGYNEVVVHKQVTINGKVDYPAMMSMDSSRMFSTNLMNFLKLFIDVSGNLMIDWNNEIVRSSCLTHDGKIMHNKVETESKTR